MFSNALNFSFQIEYSDKTRRLSRDFWKRAKPFIVRIKPNLTGLIIKGITKQVYGEVFMKARSDRLLDEKDLGILKILQGDCRIPLEQIADELGVPKSTIHYRIKRLEEEGIVEGYYAKVNHARLGKDYLTITFIRAKYGPGYHKKAGQKLAQIPGVWGVYFVFGDNDFIIISKSNDREEYLQKLEQIMNMPEVERTNTEVIAKVIKEEPRVEIEI